MESILKATVMFYFEMHTIKSYNQLPVSIGYSLVNKVGCSDTSLLLSASHTSAHTEPLEKCRGQILWAGLSTSTLLFINEALCELSQLNSEIATAQAGSTDTSLR